MAGELILQIITAKHKAEGSDRLLENRQPMQWGGIAGADARRDSLVWCKNFQALICCIALL